MWVMVTINNYRNGVYAILNLTVFDDFEWHWALIVDDIERDLVNPQNDNCRACIIVCVTAVIVACG